MNEERSFAAGVRQELAAHISRNQHCQKAELRAVFEGSHHERPFTVYSEGLTIPEKYISLVRNVYRLEPEMDRAGHENRVRVPNGGSRIYEDLMSEKTLERDCCKRAYLRGWFLAAGTVSNPEGQYDLEIVAETDEQACFIRSILDSFDLGAKLTHRKGRSVLYMKEGQKVVDFLNIVGAHVALMEFENTRILKEVRGRVNRRVNCETANIKKTISASSKQVEDIRLINDTIGWEKLPESLRQMARVRMDNPDVSLAELGELLDPPVGKSGVNHRLRRLSEIAADIRNETIQNEGESTND